METAMKILFSFVKANKNSSVLYDYSHIKCVTHIPFVISVFRFNK